jgi:protein TonB
MFDAMLVSTRGSISARSGWALPVSALGHLAALALAVTASYLIVDTVVSAPDRPIEIVIAAPAAGRPALPPPPPLGSAGGAATPVTPEPEQELEPIVQPLDIPETLLEETIGRGDVGSLGELLGDPDGVLGGVLGGIPDGDPDGDLSGDRNGDGPRGVTGPVMIVPGMLGPVLKHRVEPAYPPSAIKARLQGRVILQAVISADGAVEEVEVLRSSPFFDQAAIAAVRQWRYEPARLRGRPVAVYFTVQVDFRLEP